MTKNDLIQKIKTQLKGLITTKFAQVKAGDLIITSPDEVLQVGSEVFTPDADGNNVPLVDGDYVLDSGVTIMVAAGKVIGIHENEKEVESELAEVVPAETTETEDKLGDEVKPDISEEMKKMAERLAKCEMMIEKMVKEKEMMEAQLTKLSEVPSTKSIDVKPTEFKSIDEKKEGVNIDIASIREKIRKNR